MQGYSSGDKVLVPICQAAWQRVYGFSNSKVARLKMLVAGGVEHPVHRNKCSVALTTKRSEAVAFMSGYFNENCEKMPDPSGCRDSWHLPHTTTKAEVYLMYRQFYEAQGADPEELVAGCYFKDIWLSDFPHVTIPERSRFKQCTM